jgi:hypothetical protein
LLAAQYESYILPLAVLLSIPTGLLCFSFINLAGIENNIYVQVGIIVDWSGKEFHIDCSVRCSPQGTGMTW